MHFVIYDYYWSALYVSAAMLPGVHIHKKTLPVLNPFSIVRRALFVTIIVVPVALIQCYRTWVGKILRHVGRHRFDNVF